MFAEVAAVNEAAMATSPSDVAIGPVDEADDANKVFKFQTS